MEQIQFEDYIEAASDFEAIFVALKQTEVPAIIKSVTSLKERLAVTFLSVSPIYFIATDGDYKFTKDFVLISCMSYFMQDVGRAMGRNFLLSPLEYIGQNPHSDALKKLKEKIKKSLGEKEKRMYIPMLKNQGIRYMFLFVAFLSIASPIEAFEFANNYIEKDGKTNEIISAFFNE